MKTYKRFGEFARYMRTAMWYSQEDIARKVGLTRTSIANIEAGRQRILLHQIEDFARAFKIPTIELAKAIWAKGVHHRHL